jgi:hypothetical protein
MSHEAFLIGSRAYGNPKVDSDVDLVVYMSPDDAKTLLENADMSIRHDELYHSCRYGNLNIMVCVDDAYYDTWVKGNKVLRLCKPVTRDVAIATFEHCRKHAGISEMYEQVLDNKVVDDPVVPAQIYWQPMIDAPIDGTFVLLKVDSGYICIDDVIITARWCTAKKRWENQSSDAISDEFGDARPRGWSPLPIGHR